VELAAMVSDHDEEGQDEEADEVPSYSHYADTSRLQFNYDATPFNIPCNCLSKTVLKSLSTHVNTRR
jgi:hypothetical protein